MFYSLSQEQIISLLLQYKYLIFFPLVVIEGPIVTTISGFLTSLGYFNIFFLYVIAVIGDVSGDVLYYSLGYFGGKRIYTRGRFLWIKMDQVQKLKNHFDNHFGKTLLFGKWTQSFGAAVLVASGVAKVPLGKFVWYNFVGTVPKTLLFLLVGYYFGRSITEFDTYFGYFTVIMFFAIVLGAGIFYFIRKRREK